MAETEGSGPTAYPVHIIGKSNISEALISRNLVTSREYDVSIRSKRCSYALTTKLYQLTFCIISKSGNPTTKKTNYMRPGSIYFINQITLNIHETFYPNIPN